MLPPISAARKRCFSFTMAFARTSLMAFSLLLTSCSGVEAEGELRHFAGVWLYELEGSTFIEGATDIPSERPPYDETDWLDWLEEPRLEALIEDHVGDPDCHEVQPFLITFIGRRTRNPDRGAGHMALWRSEVTIDRTISAKRLSPSFCYDG